MSKPRVLLVDDHIGDITWMVDYLETRGYDIDHVTNEDEARRSFTSIKGGDLSYVLVIMDIMVAVKDIMDLVELDEGFYKDSKETGIRLCRFVREELRISADELPIVGISGRADDADIQQALKDLGPKQARLDFVGPVYPA